MGPLDSLFAALGSIPGWMGSPAQAQPAPQPPAPGIMPQPEGPGFGQRIGAGLQGFLNSSSPMGALGNLIGGVTSGQRTDPAGVQSAAVQGMLRQLLAQGKIDQATASFLAANPSSWNELSKAMINQPLTMGASGDMITMGPFGQPQVRGAVPVSEPGKRIDPNTNRTIDVFNVKPSLSRPGGGVVVPGQAPPQGQAAPQQAGPQQRQMPRASVNPAYDPSQPNGGQPNFSALSPQETEELQARGKIFGEDFATVQKAGRGAVQTKNVLQVMSKLNPQVFSGAAAPLQQYVTSAASSFGIAPDKLKNKASAGDLFGALSNELVLASAGGSLGSQISNGDRDFIASRFPIMSQTEGGRRDLIAYLDMLADRQIQVSKLAEDYSAPNGPGRGSMRGFTAYMKNYAEENPIFESFATRFDAATPAPAPQTRGVATSSETSIVNPRTGERRVLRGGQWVLPK